VGIVPPGVDFWTVGSTTIVLAGSASALVLGWIRLGWPAWLLACIACLPVVLLALLPDHRLISFHGFLHSAISYRILAGGIPPFDPLFAETPLLYPWAHHAVVAAFSRATGLSPASWFVAINVLALGATLATVYAVCASLFRDRTTAIFGAALALYGLASLPIAAVFGLFPAIELETRLIPIQKYASTNSNALGFWFYSMGLLALVRLSDRGNLPTRRSLAALFAAVLAAAIFYPLAWAPLAGVALATAAIASRTAATRPTAFWIFAAAASASAIALPYLWTVQIGKSASATLGLDLSAAHLLRNSANLVLVAFGWLGLLVFGLPELRRVARQRPAACGVLIAAATIPAVMFWPSHTAVHSEYKFLALCGFSLAIPSALVVKKVYDRNVLLCFALLCILFAPAASFFTQLARYDFQGDAPSVLEHAQWILPANEHERALTEWIRTATAGDAVFVDSELSIPPFAHRQLYVAMPPNTGLAGWGLPPLTFLAEVFGHPIDEIAHRRNVTRALLSAQRLDRALAMLRRDISARELYVIARTPASLRLSQHPELERVFETGRIRVFRVATPH
jgi:hypothetical protein